MYSYLVLLFHESPRLSSNYILDSQEGSSILHEKQQCTNWGTRERQLQQKTTAFIPMYFEVKLSHI